jgi:hypothetical protein
VLFEGFSEQGARPDLRDLVPALDHFIVHRTNCADMPILQGK